MYDNDLAIFSPSSAGFQQLLNICPEYEVKFDVLYNAKKSAVLICRTKVDKDLCLPDFYLLGQVMSVCNKIKYLGHYITDQLSDGECL